ncbi:MAG: PDZ domain-containing protein, partial [Chloroflexi bacterium]
AILSQHKAGDTLRLTVQHGDSQKTVNVTLAESPVAAPPASSPPSATPQNGQPSTNPDGRRGSLLAGPFLGIVPVGVGQFENKLDFDSGLMQPGGRIMQVASGSPAENAGLKVGEIILAIDGTQIDAQNNLKALLSSHKPGDSVRLNVQGTDGTQREVTVTLSDHPQSAGTAYLGVTTGGFGQGRMGPGHMFEFGLPGGQNGANPPGIPNLPNLVQHPGAIIIAVTQNSPAERAGLKAGQVIESVGGTRIDSPQALSTVISGHKPGDNVTLSVYDPQADQTSNVQISLGDHPQNAGTAWLGIEYRYFNMPNVNPQGTPSDSGTQF